MNSSQSLSMNSYQPLKLQLCNKIRSNTMNEFYIDVLELDSNYTC